MALPRELGDNPEILSLTKQVHALLFKTIKLSEVPGIRDERFAAEMLQYTMRTGFDTGTDARTLTAELRTVRYLGRLLDDVDSCTNRPQGTPAKAAADAVQESVRADPGFLTRWWQKNRRLIDMARIEAEPDYRKQARALGILPGRGSRMAVLHLTRRYRQKAK